MESAQSSQSKSNQAIQPDQEMEAAFSEMDLLVKNLKMPRRRRRVFRWIVVLTGLIACVSLLVYFKRPLLTAAGRLLVYESELKPGDVVVVLTGGGTARLERAIELLKAGMAPKILMTLPEVVPRDAAYYDLYTTENTMCKAVMEFRGIPPEQIAWSDQAFYSTYSEAVFLRDWMKRNQCRSAIVSSGYFQSRRAKWSMDHAFRGSDFTIQIAPAPEELYSVEEWWKNEEGIIMVENEYLKTAYYWVKGLIGRP
ncbi:MAG: YdcF family protein [Candidatus Omnitrophica bacterium]|nr:YdcF family protein [Candidatus Omnitrophota bacterium]